MPEIIQKLQELSEISGVSGDEGRVRAWLQPQLENHVDQIQVDAVGNLICYKKGSGEQDLRLMLTAHMDEVGLMVVGYNSDGTLQVETIGGIPARTLPGLHVNVGSTPLPGVIGIKAIHRMEQKSENSAPAVSALAVDIGATTADEAKRCAPLGTSISFVTKFTTMEETVYGKALDNRVGCAILLTLLQGELFPFDVFGVFTVQEEVGLRGATVASYRINPDVAIVLEGTLADEYPREDQDVSTTSKLGLGPAITVKDRTYITPPRLLKHFVQTAEKYSLTYQLKQPGISGTEAGSIHKSRSGVPVITVAVPCRYIHSPISLTRIRDIQNTYELVNTAVRALQADTLNFPD
ncbi:MAG: hypothetical protein P1S60_16265, partial [Anaerolineae bacterium]|nr:hypothetical protein [Anaerolineae bacterium]